MMNPCDSISLGKPWSNYFFWCVLSPLVLACSGAVLLLTYFVFCEQRNELPNFVPHIFCERIARTVTTSYHTPYN
jgi:hypothetical protein